MATGTQAIERIAAATGIPAAVVDRHARVLKKHNPPMWAKSRLGGPKGVGQVQPNELVNLTVSLIVSDPITEAAAQVQHYRDLVARDPMLSHVERETTEDTSLVLLKYQGTKFNVLETGAKTLGGKLDGLVKALALAPSAMRERQGAGWACVLESVASGTPSPVARAHLEEVSGDGIRHTTYEKAAEAELPGLAPAGPSPASILTRSTRITFALMEVLGELYADTLAQTAPALPYSDAPVSPAGPETTEAAEAPPSAASEIGQPATESPAAPNSADVTLSPQGNAMPESQDGRSHPEVISNRPLHSKAKAPHYVRSRSDTRRSAAA